MVVSGSGDTTIRLWDRKTGQQINIIEGHSSAVTAVAMDDAIIVSGSEDNTIRLWDRNTGQQINVLEGHSDGVTAVAMDDTMVVSGSRDNTIRLWDRKAGQGREICRFTDDYSIHAVTKLMDRVIGGDDKGMVQMFLICY